MQVVPGKYTRHPWRDIEHTHTGDTTMPKIELRMTDADKARMQAAADASQLRLATWAKAQLMMAVLRTGRGDGQ